MAKLDPCINCGNEGQHLHHVVPKVLGGNEGSNLVSLCETCHANVHEVSFTNHKTLTKVGLQKAKERGVRLGAYREGVFVGRVGTPEDAAKARAGRIAKANNKANDLRPIFEGYAGLSHSEVARRLNDAGILTTSGKGVWNASTVSRVRDRLSILEAECGQTR